jgi:UDP-glucose 4-epimerase
VRALARRPAPSGLFANDVEQLSGDILDPAILSRAVAGTDTVIHLAALLHITDPPPSLRQEYERVNISGTEMLVATCAQSSVQRLVYFSTIAVYGYNNTGILTEGTEPRPDTFYGRTKLDAERIVLRARNRDGQPMGTVLRMAAVYGGRVKGNYFRLVRSLMRGRFVPIGRGKNHRALIYDKDAAEAAVLAAEHPAAAGQIFNVSDGMSPTLADIIENISRALGRRPPRFFLPAMPIRLLIQVAHFVATPLKLPIPVTPSTFAKYLEDVRVDSSRIRERLGFQPRFDQAAGWRQAIAEMRGGQSIS